MCQLKTFSLSGMMSFNLKRQLEDLVSLSK